MRITVIANDEQRMDWEKPGVQTGHEIIWLSEMSNEIKAEVIIDLDFKNEEGRVSSLINSGASILIVNSVSDNGIPASFIRINGWKGFLERNILEASSGSQEKMVTEVAAIFSRTVQFVPNIPGFISARVVSMIINEAFFALEEKISTKDEIDTAMKLGTNYPYGPFEWCKMIGASSIFNLLEILAKEDERYQPAPLLKLEAQP
jgi:3-hydroxybutyryl-CoA dehydrogenase